MFSCINKSLRIVFAVAVAAVLISRTAAADDYPKTYEIRYGVKQKETNPFSRESLDQRRAQVRAKFLARNRSTSTSRNKKSVIDVERKWTRKVISGNRTALRAYEKNALKVSPVSTALNFNGGFLHYYFEHLQYKILRVTVASEREHDALKTYYALLPSRKFALADLSIRPVNRWNSKRVK